MDTSTLVDERIEDGQRLIHRLESQEFPLTAACWLKLLEEDQERWRLYVATPAVEKLGLGESHVRIQSALRALGPTSIDGDDIKVIRSDDPVARAIVDHLQYDPTGSVARHRLLPRLPRLSAEDIHVYASIGRDRRMPKLWFTVRYVRTAGDQWRATAVNEGIHRDLDAKGAVSYTTAAWSGEDPHESAFAMVGVVVEVDPRYEADIAQGHPQWMAVLSRQANRLADDLFLTHHPGAFITHAEDEPKISSPATPGIEHATG